MFFSIFLGCVKSECPTPEWDFLTINETTPVGDLVISTNDGYTGTKTHDVQQVKVSPILYITLEISDIQIDESLSKFFDEFVDGSTVGLKLNKDLSPYVDCVGRYILPVCLWFIDRRISGLGRTPNWREQCCSW